MGPERSTKAVAAWLLALPISAALAMPAEAGGWGKGPSWKQARKIVTQAGKDIKNGWNDPVIGTVMFLGEVNAGFRGTAAILVHDLATWVSIPLIAGHLYLALLHPSTRPSLRGMVRGSVRRDWARRHHPKWEKTL